MASSETLKNFIDVIGQNWIGTTLGVIGLVFAIYEAKKHRGPKISYQFIGQRLIGEVKSKFPGGLEVLYEGKKISSLSLTYLIVWNKGFNAVKRSDVSDHDPILFKFRDGSKIYSAEVTKVIREANQFGISYKSGDGSGLAVKFDFLDSGDGALVSIWHDSPDLMPDCSGTIIGQKSGPVSYGRFVIRSRNAPNLLRPSNTIEKIAIFVRPIMYRFDRIFPFAVIIAGVAMAVLPLLEDYFPELLKTSGGSEKSRWIPVSIGTFYALLGVWLYAAMRPKFPKILLPDEFGFISRVQEAGREP